MSSESPKPAEQRDLVRARLEEALGESEQRYANGITRWAYPEIMRAWYLMQRYVSWDELSISKVSTAGLSSRREILWISFDDILAAEDVGALLRQRVAEHGILQAE